MTKQLVLPEIRRQPLLARESPASSRFAELAGGTTAECAAVCCCCPCGLADFVVLAVFRLPAGLCRRALKKKGKKKQGLLIARKKQESEFQIHPSPESAVIIWPDFSPATMGMPEMDKELWEKFSTGFWRSLSERSDRTICE